MEAPPRLAVFDVDGTLIDSQHNIVASMTAAHRAHGLAEPPPEAIRRIIGLSMAEAVAVLLPGDDERLHLAVVQSYRDAFFTLRSQPGHSEPLFPGAVDALDQLQSLGWLLGIATGKSRRGLDAMIERHGFHGRFVTLQTADGHLGKPHPGMVLSAMAETGIGPENTVMIGDTTFDIVMGKNARVRVAGVAWGYHPPEELLAAGAEILVEDYRHLPAALDGLFGRAQCALQRF